MIVKWGVGTDYNGEPLFWNLKTAPGQEPKGCTYPNQIASLKLGNSYIFNIRNNTQYPHPIRFHGHTFRVLNSNKKAFDSYLSDTVLEENEQVQVAFVADNLESKNTSNKLMAASCLLIEQGIVNIDYKIKNQALSSV